MIGIECSAGETATLIARECFANGMVIETAGPNDEVVKFFCPLTITQSEMEQGMKIFEKAVDNVAAKLIKKAS